MGYEIALQYGKFIESFVQKNPEGNIYDDFFSAEFKKNANDRIIRKTMETGSISNYKARKSKIIAKFC